MIIKKDLAFCFIKNLSTKKVFIFVVFVKAIFLDSISIASIFINAKLPYISFLLSIK